MWGKGNYFPVNASYSDSCSHCTCTIKANSECVQFALFGESEFDERETLLPGNADQVNPRGSLHLALPNYLDTLLVNII